MRSYRIDAGVFYWIKKMSDYIQSEQLAEIHAALSKAQSEMGKALKDSSNPFYKSKYASLSSVWEAIGEALANNGLSITHHTEPSEKGVIINTALRHKSGQFIESGFMFFPAAKMDAQGFGSALTYARRYQLSALVGVCTEDDDGQAASKPPSKPTQPAVIDKDHAIKVTQTFESLSKSEDRAKLINDLEQQYWLPVMSDCVYYLNSHDEMKEFWSNLYPPIKHAIQPIFTKRKNELG